MVWKRKNREKNIKETIESALEDLMVLSDELHQLENISDQLIKEKAKLVDTHSHQFTRYHTLKSQIKVAEGMTHENMTAMMTDEMRKQLLSLELQKERLSSKIQEQNQMKVVSGQELKDISLQEMRLNSLQGSIRERREELLADLEKKTLTWDSVQKNLQLHKEKSKRNPHFVTALAFLKKEMPTTFFGPLSSCARCVDGKHEIPVNSVLRNILKRTILVQSRSVADRCISYFRDNRIGIVSCEILDDIRELEPPNYQAGGLWLPDLLEYTKPDFKKVFRKIFGYWWLIPSLNDRMDVPGSRRNFVTLSGELNFWYGEISRPGSLREFGSLLLKDSFLDLHSNNHENPQTRTDLSNLTSMSEALHKEILSIKVDLESSLRQLNRTTLERNDITQKKCATAADLQSFESVVQRLEHEKLNLTKRIYKLNQDIKHTEDIPKEDKHYANLMSQLENLIGSSDVLKRYEQIKAKLEKSDSKRASTRARLCELKSHKTKSERQVSNIESELKVMSERYKRLQDEIRLLKSELLSSSEQLTSLAQEVTDNEGKYNKYAQSLKKEELQLQSLKAEHEVLVEMMTTTKTELGNITVTITTLKDSLQKLDSHIMEDTEYFQEEHNHLESLESNKAQLKLYKGELQASMNNIDTQVYFVFSNYHH
eukprot:TRINITY_DN4566_c0_g1_i2.p1 TRINITY_DN4566_c0_g1~~TRINITY_DN4566_c0_g1_i2.p1  ORF type:complete len:655 (-),score=78.90 TRINITY_DN4566_c0_g1_i2:649-2613(-)